MNNVIGSAVSNGRALHLHQTALRLRLLLGPQQERLNQQADLLLIAANLPTPLAAHNLADQVLLWSTSADLRGVMCAGRWLLANGQVLGMDEVAVRARVAEAAARLWQAG